MMLSFRKWFALAGFGLALVAGTAGAAAEAGREYKPVANPQAVETGAKIEVIEFFWYGCPHCFDLEPLLKKWEAKLPKDVELRRVPGLPTERWTPLARTFYTLEALGELPRLHGQVFDAVNLERVRLEDEATQLDWMEKKGIDRKKFADTWKSFSVQSKVKRAAQLTQAFEITGVPSLIVDGKYLTSVSMAGTSEQLLATLDELIVKARAERGKKK